MTSPTITLDHLIQTRLAEIAEDAWQDHRVMPVRDGNARILQLGTAAVEERWYCQADHGDGLCNEPLLPHRQASTLLGMYNDDEPIPHPQLPPVEIELLDPSIGCFMTDALFHWSDVVSEYRKAQG
ncbi:hypothetical protein [Streptomyces rochei]|uniref:hypothetical protein n=1 Tax=Streptomyces rochei TaxID=1928 RepID=UPI0034081929